MSDGYQIVDKATQAPGWCVICHDIDGPFVDSQHWIQSSHGSGPVDPYGYFCTSCVEALGKAISMRPQREVVAVTEKANEMAAELSSLRGKVEALSQANELIGAVND